MKRLQFYVFTLFFVLSAGAFAQDSGQDDLFVALPDQFDSRSEPQNPVVLRKRSVAINMDRLPDAAAPLNNVVSMNLFTDANLDVVLDDIAPKSNSRYIWKGYVFGEENSSSVSLSMNNGAMVGNVRSADGYYQIRTDSVGNAIIREVDETQYPDCASDEDHIMASDPLDAPGGIVTRDSAGTFDVLVVYTQAARIAAGGTAAMESLIDLAISETNEIFSNSQINSQVRLVHQREVNYTEDTFDNDLDNLRDQNDGLLDEVHGLRDAYGADMVSLLVDGSGSCGIAFLMGNLSSGFDNKAFSVVDWDCATGYYSFAHELGHNMGSHHATPESTQGSALLPYSHGWRWTSSSGTDYRSVMAYSPGIRVNHFSNPNVQHEGQSTGNNINASNGASNAASINYAASTIANWRQSVNSMTAVPLDNFDTAGPPSGPFDPTAKTYSIVNSSSSSINWTASANKSWIVLSSNGGSLVAGAEYDLNVALGSGVNSLSPGNYSGTIQIRDTTHSITTTREVNLTIESSILHRYSMDTDPGWTTSGDWEYGTPLGQGSYNGDPDSGHTGSKVYGYNLSGNYANNLPATSLTTPSFDLSSASNTSISFWRWLGIEYSNYDKASFEISTNGSSWTKLWDHTSTSITDTEWLLQEFDISQYADGKSNVRFRWVMGSTDQSVNYPGWNIDDVEIRGESDSIVPPPPPPPPAPLPEAWVDFNGSGNGNGSVSNPFNTVNDAVNALVNDGSGVVRIIGNLSTVSTGETITIVKPMTMVADGGAIVIGDAN